MGIYGRAVMKKKYIFVAELLVLIALCAGLFTGWHRRMEQDEPQKKKLLVVTSFYPVYIAAANIANGCDGIEVRNLSEPQTGCLHDFQLTPEDMKLLSEADVFFVNGGGMESFLGGVTEQYPNLPVFYTSDGLTISEDNAHAWMSVRRYRSQTWAIAEQLSEIAPGQKEQLIENAKEYDGKLAGLEEQQEEIKQAVSGSKIISLHDAYAYLADDYGLETVYGLNLDEERQIGAKEVADVLFAVERENVSVIFAEELYGKELSEAVQKEADVSVCYLDTLVRGEYDLESYLKGMQNNINRLKSVFGVF